MIRRLATGIVMLAVAISAHDVITTPITFSREISRLVYSRCASCHRPGGSAFSLVTYEAARPWAKAIKDEVLERRMPPWGAVKGFGDFRGDQGLTQEQIELISDWVEGGAPEGEASLLPKLPDFAEQHSTAAPPPGIAVDGAFTLKSALTVAGIQPKGTQAGATFMAVAERPDGSVEPLLWLYNYNPKFAHPYWYSANLRLPAGTKISVTPAGAVTLLKK
jgi:hypothetical protein